MFFMLSSLTLIISNFLGFVKGFEIFFNFFGYDIKGFGNSFSLGTKAIEHGPKTKPFFFGQFCIITHTHIIANFLELVNRVMKFRQSFQGAAPDEKSKGTKKGKKHQRVEPVIQKSRPYENIE